MGIFKGLSRIYKKEQPRKTLSANVSGGKFKKQKMTLSEYNEWKKGTVEIPLDSQVFEDNTKKLSPVFEALLRIPLVSSSVWAWKWLSYTENDFIYIGGTDSEQKRSKMIIEEMAKRAVPFSYTKGNAFSLILDQYFQSIYSYGRFAATIKISEDMSKIENINIIDGLNIYAKKENGKFDMYYNDVNTGSVTYLRPETSFYYGLNMSHRNPYGTSFLETATSLISLSDEMLEDMKLSSHNAGLPRLHIKIAQPEILENETEDQYSERVNSYFSNTVEEFSEIGADDNFYTWSDIEIGTVSGYSATGFVWKANRGVVMEEIIGAFHLFPWMVGNSASTTKNWVTAQMQLIINQADAIQKTASNLVEWLANTELKLKGVTEVTATHKFERPRDPSARDINIAEQFKISNINTLISKGYISPDEGARRLGLFKMYDPEKLYESQKNKKTTKEKGAKENE